MDEPKRLVGKQAKALAALLDGLNLQDAASAAGVNRKTLRRWLDEDGDFWRAYQRSSGASLQLAARRLTGKLDGAVALLGESWTTRAPRPAFAFALPSWCWTARCACWTRPILKPAWQRWKNS